MTKKTKSDCDHISKVVEWGYKLTDGQVHEYVTLWGCTKCDKTSKTLWKSKDKFIKIDHSKCNTNPCFGCKAKGLQLSTGDANSSKIMSNKKWHGELDAYRAARAQGIQPAGTSMAAIQEAHRASEAMGKAYDADTMINTQAIQKESVTSLKDAGAI